jgi:hypothetical protein
MLAFDITNPVTFYEGGSNTWRGYPWRLALTELRPDLVRDVYLAVARLRFERGDRIIEGLSELLNNLAF